MPTLFCPGTGTRAARVDLLRIGAGADQDPRNRCPRNGVRVAGVVPTARIFAFNIHCMLQWVATAQLWLGLIDRSARSDEGGYSVVIEVLDGDIQWGHGQSAGCSKQSLADVGFWPTWDEAGVSPCPSEERMAKTGALWCARLCRFA